MINIEKVEKELYEVFVPATPIADPYLLKGREGVLSNIKAAYLRKGSGVVVFGDRGVGKSSIIKVAKQIITDGDHYYHSASSQDSFDSIMLSCLDNYNVSQSITEKVMTKTGGIKGGLSFFGSEVGVDGTGSSSVKSVSIGESMLTPQVICKRLQGIKGMVIIDDFETISSKEERRKFSDLIKKLSDNDSSITLVIVGISKSLDELLDAHQSSQRSISEVKVERLPNSEIQKIIVDGMSKLKIRIGDELVSEIVQISANFPYYTHLICEGCVRVLIDQIRSGESKELVINAKVLRKSIKYSIENAKHTISSTYTNAILRKKSSDRFMFTLFAIAMNQEEPVKYNQISNMVSKLEQKNEGLTNVSHYLFTLCSDGILERVGRAGYYKYKDPLMKAYVILMTKEDSKGNALKIVNAMLDDVRKRLDNLE